MSGCKGAHHLSVGRSDNHNEVRTFGRHHDQTVAAQELDAVGTRIASEVDRPSYAGAGNVYHGERVTTGATAAIIGDDSHPAIAARHNLVRAVPRRKRGPDLVGCKVYQVYGVRPFVHDDQRAASGILRVQPAR
jgi:hypothetical protein